MKLKLLKVLKREIRTLSSQMRQGIVERIKHSLKALRRAKEKGRKVGKLLFKSDVRSSME